MVVIAGNVAGAAVGDGARLAGECVPDRRSSAVLARCSLDLVGGGGEAPGEVGRKGLGEPHRVGVEHGGCAHRWMVVGVTCDAQRGLRPERACVYLRRANSLVRTPAGTYRGDVLLARGAAKLSKPVVFVSDLGLRDEFVGVCHAVIARISPGSTVIDISHGIAPHDVRAGGLVLAESLRFAPADAVGLAVIDPGSGRIGWQSPSKRSRGASSWGPTTASCRWRGGRTAVSGAPSSSTRRMSFSSRSPASSTVETSLHLPRRTWRREPTSQSWVRRLRSPTTEVRLAEPEVERGRITGEVLDIDRFGNVRLNVRPLHLVEQRWRRRPRSMSPRWAAKPMPSGSGHTEEWSRVRTASSSTPGTGWPSSGTRRMPPPSWASSRATRSG